MYSIFRKLFQWEYWSFTYFYIPMYIYYLWLSLKAKNLFFISASNPLMELGGFVNYSKSNILKQIDPKYLPNIVYLESENDRQQIAEKLIQAKISFPLVAKPDKGERGKHVRKIDSMHQLKSYLNQTHGTVILQDFIDMPLEFGILYYRFPNESSGHISSIVQKGFLTVAGNGTSTVKELLEAHPRGQFYVSKLALFYPSLMGKRPENEQKILIEPIGNHSRGTVFMDANHLINHDLINVFDTISMSIEGFSFGRYDIKVNSLEELYMGKNIKIMELNGVNSEPAHIYDPKNQLWKAYRDLVRHWNVIYEVSTRNHRELGIPYASWSESYRILFKS